MTAVVIKNNKPLLVQLFLQHLLQLYSNVIDGLLRSFSQFYSLVLARVGRQLIKTFPKMLSIKLHKGVFFLHSPVWKQGMKAVKPKQYGVNGQKIFFRYLTLQGLCS